MTSAGQTYHRTVLRQAILELLDAARSQRAAMSASAPERHFYLGVEAAAEEFLHPELAMSRGPRWLDLETPAFRSGYLKTSSRVARAMTATEPPLRLALPMFDRPTSGSHGA